MQKKFNVITLEQLYIGVLSISFVIYNAKGFWLFVCQQPMDKTEIVSLKTRYLNGIKLLKFLSAVQSTKVNLLVLLSITMWLLFCHWS